MLLVGVVLPAEVRRRQRRMCAQPSAEHRPPQSTMRLPPHDHTNRADPPRHDWAERNALRRPGQHTGTTLQERIDAQSGGSSETAEDQCARRIVPCTGMIGGPLCARSCAWQISVKTRITPAPDGHRPDLRISLITATCRTPGCGQSCRSAPSRDRQGGCMSAWPIARHVLPMLRVVAGLAAAAVLTACGSGPATPASIARHQTHHRLLVRPRVPLGHPSVPADAGLRGPAFPGSVGVSSGHAHGLGRHGYQAPVGSVELSASQRDVRLQARARADLPHRARPTGAQHLRGCRGRHRVGAGNRPTFHAPDTPTIA